MWYFEKEHCFIQVSCLFLLEMDFFFIDKFVRDEVTISHIDENEEGHRYKYDILLI